MTIREAYKIAVNDARSRSPQTGYTQDQAEQLEKITTRLAGLAAFLGWEHEIIIDDCSNEYERIMKILNSSISDRHEFNKYSHTYEIAGIISNDKHAPFGQI